ncbi:MAG: hypothetical protein ACI37T_08870 [Candidatus Gastranaerophilaceae bacterium]
MSKLIRIIKGVYGFKNGLTTIPKTPKDKPFEVDDEKAKRLISEGIAELATEVKNEAEPIVKYSVNLAKKEGKEVKTAPKNEPADEAIDLEGGVEFSEENTKDELLAILEKTGYTITSATKRLSKAELVALIEEQFSDEPVDEVEAPSFEDDGVVE